MWDWTSKKTFGHTFAKHGEGTKNIHKLRGTAGGTGEPQGQWLDNETAAKFLQEQRDKIICPTVVDIPKGLGQVIKSDGKIVPATKAGLIPRGKGYRTAYPVE